MSLEKYNPEKVIYQIQLDLHTLRKYDKKLDVVKDYKKILRIEFLKSKKEQFEAENPGYTININDEGEFTIE